MSAPRSLEELPAPDPMTTRQLVAMLSRPVDTADELMPLAAAS